MVLHVFFLFLGYVLSAEALRRFVTKGITDKTGVVCRSDGAGAEDVEMGKCMENLNVEAGDSRDAQGRGRFFPFVPEHHLIPGHVPKDFWYWQYIYYPSEEVCIFLLQDGQSEGSCIPLFKACCGSINNCQTLSLPLGNESRNQHFYCHKTFHQTRSIKYQ